MKETKVFCDNCHKEIKVRKDPLENVFDLLFKPDDIEDICEITISRSVGTDRHFELCNACAQKFADCLDKFFDEAEEKKND